MSNYRKEEFCKYCRRNEFELCDADDEPCLPLEYYQKGRKDAIDELFENISSIAFGNRKGLVHFKDIVSIFEQLKEK